jgi:hypothetical protein
MMGRMDHDNMRRLITVAGLVSLLFASCSKQPAPKSPASPDAPVLKVAFRADDSFTVDGKESTMESLRQSLRELKAKHGVVWFYRDAPDPQVYRYALMEFLEDVAESRIPIRTSKRPDYSDSAPMDGDARLIQFPPS